MLALLLAGCAPEVVSLQWYEESLGQCPVTGYAVWDLPTDTNVLTITVRRAMSDGRVIYQDATGIVVDATGRASLACAEGSDVTVTYAVQADE